MEIVKEEYNLKNGIKTVSIIEIWYIARWMFEITQESKVIYLIFNDCGCFLGKNLKRKSVYAQTM